MKNNPQHVILFIILLTLLMGCGGEETAEIATADIIADEPTATIRPTDTKMPSPTFTAAATNTATPTNTPTPTSTFTPTPTDTPEPTNTPTPTATSTATPVPTLPPPPPTAAPTDPPPPAAFATWKNIPIMPGAHDAFEDSSGSYWYLVDTSGANVRQFYTQTIGWDVLLETGDNFFGNLWIGNGSCQTSVLYEDQNGITGVMITNGCP